MAERPHDLIDLLHAAESEREHAVHGTATDDVLRRTRAELRAARARRTVLTSVGAAAAVAVLVAGVTVWAPGPVTQPAAPSPSEATTSSVASVPGLPPLRQATEEELRDAPEGSVLVLWEQGTPRVVEMRRQREASDVWVLLVQPDGEVLQVTRAPQRSGHLMAWDRAAATVVLSPDDDPTRADTSPVVLDLLTGRSVGEPSDDWPGARQVSPDGSREAWAERVEDGREVRVGDGDRELGHPLADGCMLLGWADDAQLLVGCVDTSEPAPAPGDETSTLQLMDASTGVLTEPREIAESWWSWNGVAEGRWDGRMVLTMSAGPIEEKGRSRCRTRLDAAQGVLLMPVGQIPGGVSLDPPAVVAGDRALVAADPCSLARSSIGIWSVDLVAGGGDVEVLVPTSEDLDDPIGVVAWTTAAK